MIETSSTHLREGKKAKRNSQSVPYNPITLAYDESIGGMELRNKDDHIRYRAAARASNLLSRMSFTPYDPITGADKPRPSVPVKPPNWEDVRDVHEREQQRLQAEAQRINDMMQER